MTNSELKFVAKVFSTICTDTYECVYSINSGIIDACPIKNTELSCIDCSEKVWYEFLKQMEKNYPRKDEEKHDD